MPKHKKVSVWEKYDVDGEEVERKGKTCPRCGDGVFMADHEDRLTCGRCGFSQMKEEE
ncbi:MAG: 30S ribosomal protein S27ae [Candidatus Aenigmatarchaeota archaeon]